MIFESRIGSQVVRADCAGIYARAAKNVLYEFEKLACSGIPLRSRTKMRFGWTLLRLKNDDGCLLITEPDFAIWPAQGWSRTIDTSLEVLTAQVHLLRRLNVDGEDASFDQFIIAAPGALSQPEIFLRRDSSISAEDSGWVLGSVEDPEALTCETRLERIAIANLVQLRRPLLQVLTLPPGFMVVFSANVVKQIFDPGGSDYKAITNA
jgi:hypothetical protein